MFESDADMDHIMESLRLVADAYLSPNPIKDVVNTDDLALALWADYVDSHEAVARLRKNSICYQIVRGLWLVSFGSADLLPLESVHLAYTVPHGLLAQALESTPIDDLRMIFDHPGGIDALVTRISITMAPPHVIMWGDEEAELVHNLLAKFISMDPSKPNFAEQVEAWAEEVSTRLPDPAASALQSIANMLINHYQARAGATGNPLDVVNSIETRALDLAEMVKLYDTIRDSFYAVSNQGEKESVKEIVTVAIPLTLALAEVREDVLMFGMLEQESVLFSNMDVTAKAKAMTYLSDERIKAILKELGHMLGFGTSANQLDETRSEDYTESGRIEDLNGNGLATMASDPEQFYARYATNNLQTYDRGQLQDKEGPFILIRDISGSMKGSKDIWTCALILRMAEQAFRENRPFCLVIFARDANTLKSVIVYPPNGAGELMELIRVLPHGGTDYEMALRQSLTVVENNASLASSDILLLTDGQAVVTSKFLREFRVKKRDLNLKMHGLLINLGGSKVSTASLKILCDDVRMASELTDAVAEDLLTLV